MFFLFLNCPRISSELPLDIYEEFFQKLFWETMWRFLQYSSVGYPENLPDLHHKSLWRFRWIFSWDSSRNSPRNSFPVFFLNPKIHLEICFRNCFSARILPEIPLRVSPEYFLSILFFQKFLQRILYKCFSNDYLRISSRD